MDRVQSKRQRHRLGSSPSHQNPRWSLLDKTDPEAHASYPTDPRKAQRNDLRKDLRATAKETLQVLPGLLKQLGTENEARTSYKVSSETLTRVQPLFLPLHPQPASIRVLNADTLNAAIELSHLARDPAVNSHSHGPRPAVVNFANSHNPGGGWMNGAMAQEEAICFRSSLALSLDRGRHYPLRRDEAIYSPYVLVMREAISLGHRLLELPLQDLPTISTLTIAAIRDPRLRIFRPQSTKYAVGQPYGPPIRPREKTVFARDQDRDITKAKMRLGLRIAVEYNHRLLVLGALGCGVFGNPPEDVAHCWLEVLTEDEFSGNRWKEVWFAVYDPKGEGNFEIFDSVLSGKLV